MIRRPPRSTRTDTLFPYTTLFRSRRTRSPPPPQRYVALIEISHGCVGQNRNLSSTRSRVDPPIRMGMGHIHAPLAPDRSEEHTSELQSLMRLSYAVFCLKKKKITTTY